MRKKIIFLICALALSGCANNAPAATSSDTSETSGTSETITEAENIEPSKDEAFYEKIRLNVGLSNDDPLLNLKSPVPSKVCYVGETDTLFYSDKNGLFQKNGDETIMLSDTEAMALTLYKGGLYYIVPKDDGSHYPSGTVYCLNLETGEEHSVIAQDDISNLFISDDTIYFIEQSVEKLESGAFIVGKRSMKCGIDGKDPVIDKEYTAAVDEKYIVLRGSDTMSVCDKTTSELLASGDCLSANQICIYKDKVYYIENDYDHFDRKSMCVIDCKNGSSEESTVRTIDGGYGYIDDYSFIGDELYMLGGMFFKKTEDGTISYEADAPYAAIYNGGDSLYGLKRDGTIARLIFNDDNGYRTVKGEALKYE